MSLKSKKPKKQRRALYERAMHMKKENVSVHLEKKLAKETGRKSLPVRKNDSVLIMRGDKKGEKGKVNSVDYERGRVFIEKVTRKKADGTEAAVPIAACNLLLVTLDKSDQRRVKRKGKQAGKKDKEGEKPAEAVEKKEENREKEGKVK